MMNKQNQNTQITSQRFAKKDRLRLFVELSKCQKELASSLQANQATKLSYQTVVIALIILNIITYGALLYGRYSPASSL